LNYFKLFFKMKSFDFIFYAHKKTAQFFEQFLNNIFLNRKLDNQHRIAITKETIFVFNSLFVRFHR